MACCHVGWSFAFGPISWFEDSRIEALVFEPDLQLTRIEGKAFADCPLRVICLSQRVRVLGKSRVERFKRHGQRHSRLTHMQKTCFALFECFRTKPVLAK
jgi:hypothetical protein